MNWEFKAPGNFQDRESNQIGIGIETLKKWSVGVAEKKIEREREREYANFMQILCKWDLFVPWIG